MTSHNKEGEVIMGVLQKTDQLWKLYVFAAAMAIGAGVTLFQSFLYKLLAKETITALVIGGMFLVIGAFAWAYTSITCPSCKLKLFWYSLTKVGLGTWFIWLTNLEKCPQCGSLDGLSAPARKRGKSRSSVT